MKYRKELIDAILPIQKYGCYFRLVEKQDAKFILSLRNKKNLSRYINATSNKLEDQINWLTEYKKREDKGEEFYIITMSSDGKTKFGLNRLYDITSDDYEYGSWLYGPNAPKDKAILGDLFTHALAFEVLNLKTCRMSVRKDNSRVLKYTKSFNPTFIIEDDLSYYYFYDHETWNKRKLELLKLLDYEAFEFNTYGKLITPPIVV